MSMPLVHQSLYPSRTSLLLPKPCIYGNSHATFPVRSRSSFTQTNRNGRVGYKPSNIKAMATGSSDQPSEVKATVTVLEQSGNGEGIISNPLSLELVFTELDPETKEVRSLKARVVKKVDDDQYEAEFDEVSPDYGEVGAVYVTNEKDNEIFVKEIVLKGHVILTCNSWVEKNQKRLLFTNKSTYLPSLTPSGLKRLRKEDLKSLRGDGRGERKQGDRIYDYDLYNDLGDPDKNLDLARPVLGGVQHPYPRRCRTGRPPTKKDTASESRSGYIYVPRDEEFSDKKQKAYDSKTQEMQDLITKMQHSKKAEEEAGSSTVEDAEMKHSKKAEEKAGSSTGDKFPHFAAIDALFNESLFKTPKVMRRDRFSWFRDEEFARQTLAGLNPSCIQLVRKWPLRSELDTEIYGPQESAITENIIKEEIKGCETVKEAMERKKLFILDYHDLLLPFVRQVRKAGDTTLYGSRTLFFLTPKGTLKPLAIELTRPKMDGKPQWKQVFTTTGNSTDVWLWTLAKANVLAHDSAYHQLITHWLRTHCATEPYIIAANRQLSAMHPIYRLMHPHFRYTMQINAEARKRLISAGGTIETTFAPGKYSMELSSVIYDKQWRFDHEGLPKDLISRGMAVEDPSSPHGLKLAIEDYPYANDGLELWTIITEWVSDYVNHYYPEASLIKDDSELQAWWKEVRIEGHGDKQYEQWWPKLKTPQDLIEIITTIVWVASGHHAAVNFGQYDYSGYFPNRPSITRRNMPTEHKKEEEWKRFLEKPEEILLETFPSPRQALTVMTALSVLSEHSSDEEYLGDKIQPVWAEDPVIKRAFENFHERIKELEGIIDRRNANENLFNRHGTGVMPYELLKPLSEEGVTGKGIPYSISI